MNQAAERIINNIIEAQGGHVIDSNDPENEKTYGITLRTARFWGYLDDMKIFPLETAFKIYKLKYWEPLCGNDLLQFSESLAVELMEISINSDIKQAVEILQLCLNAFNGQMRLYDELSLDGAMGPRTLQALSTYFFNKDINVLLEAVKCVYNAYLIDQVQQHEKNEEFLYKRFLLRRE